MSRLLLVNPWIHDFAVYDLWMKPVGLLFLGDFLRRQGFEVSVLDCLDRLHPAVQRFSRRRRPRHHPWGRGGLASTILPTPPQVHPAARPFKRYGVPPEILAADLPEAPPDAILVTSGMTYWYPGVVETIAWLRNHYPETPVVLGGIYATLCPHHAREHSGADHVLSGWNPRDLLHVLGSSVADFSPALSDLRPAYDLLPRYDSVTTVTAFGCPYRCRYCASPLLWPRIERRSVDSLAEELSLYVHSPTIGDVAFADDALLLTARDVLFPALERAGLSPGSLRLHTPNGLHARFVNTDMARSLKRSGFCTVRLGLETVSDRGLKGWDDKVDREAFVTAMQSLREAGFGPGAVGAYVMAGLPEQTPQEVEATLRFAHDAGATAYLTRYSPIPGTPAFAQAAAAFPALKTEPLFHNNTLLSLRHPRFPPTELRRLRDLALDLNQRLAAG